MLHTTTEFYDHALREAEASGALRPGMRVLVVAGGDTDRNALVARGYRDVVVSNVAPYGEVAPYAWECQNAARLTYPDNSFDAVLIHAALHHCRSPHSAVSEMYRVARHTVLLVEARDSLTMRLAQRLGLSATYELGAVTAHQGIAGGVEDTGVPNYIYRWTEREIDKMVRTLDPTCDPRIQYLYGLRRPVQLDLWQFSPRWTRRVLGDLVTDLMSLVHAIAPRQGNVFCAIIRKPTTHDRRFPWLTQGTEAPTMDLAWTGRH